MALLLDAGALIAVERRNPRVQATLLTAQAKRIPVRTAATALAQVWRDGTRQANLVRVLDGVEVLPMDEDDARRVGELLGATDTTDVVDAHVAVLAAPADRILTSDSGDMERLLEARGVPARVVGV